MPVPLRVLVVEDSEDDGLLLVEALRAGGFEPAALRVETADQTRAALDSQAWDVVIADYSLPRFSAPAALEVLRTQGLDLPFIVVSGQVGEETAASLMKAGAHDYLRKGDLARLAPAIRRELAEAQGRRERRRAEVALRESEWKYRQLVENLREGIWVIDQNATTTYANRSMAEMLGTTVAEMEGRHLFSFVAPGAVELAKHYLSRRERGIAERHESEFLRKDGTRIYASLETSPILSPDGAYLGAVSSVVDITARRQAEMALQASIAERKLLEREILRASEEEQRRIGRELHDGLGQALTGIAFMVHALAGDLAAAGSPHAAEAAAIRRLVTQATDLARSLAQGLSPVGVRANDLVSALEDLAARTVQVHRIPCTLASERPVDVSDDVAATNLYRIAQEAVTNALKHGRPRQIRIGLAETDGGVTLTVENDGAPFAGPREGEAPAREGEAPAEPPVEAKGMGIRLMRYRASTIGARFEVRRGDPAGTIVTCSLPRAQVKMTNDV